MTLLVESLKTSKVKMRPAPSLTILFKLAENHHTICLPGEGCADPNWSLRVALANINEKDCRDVGRAIVAVMEKYKQSMKS